MDPVDSNATDAWLHGYLVGTAIMFFAAPCIWWGALVTFAEIREWWRARRSKSESGAETADYSNVIGFRIPKDRE